MSNPIITTSSGSCEEMAMHYLQRAEKAEADLTALRARCEELEKQLQEQADFSGNMLSRAAEQKQRADKAERERQQEIEDHRATIRGHIETVRGLEDRICKQAELRKDAERERDEARLWRNVAEERERLREQIKRECGTLTRAQLEDELGKLRADLAAEQASGKAMHTALADMTEVCDSLREDLAKARNALELWIKWRNGPECPDVLFEEGTKAFHATLSALGESGNGR